ncbi:hypothetical protein LJB84_01660 [Bacteroidales bacterium OttesenSCG-928-J19]|nr:hypothetical protein [Bacteroidales bacterium OttesenSCG-928-J19]
MNKVNFKELSIYTGIAKKKKMSGDARETFADILYSQCNGIRAKNLAMKIFNSDGEMEVSPEDINLIRFTADNFCTPAFIDAINEQLNRED